MTGQPTMHGLRPVGARVTALPSPVDEIERQSGVIVPIAGPSSMPGALERAVILHVGSDLLGDSLLRPGVVIYYLGGHTIGDVVVVDEAAVIAYVEDES